MNSKMIKIISKAGGRLVDMILGVGPNNVNDMIVGKTENRLHNSVCGLINIKPSWISFQNTTSNQELLLQSNTTMSPF